MSSSARATVLSPAFSGGMHLGGTRTGLVIAWLGLIAVATYSLYFEGLKRIGANLAGTLNLGEPLAATLISTVALGERLSVAAGRRAMRSAFPATDDRRKINQFGPPPAVSPR